MKLKELNVKVQDRVQLFEKLLDVLNSLSKRPLTNNEKKIIAIVMASKSKNPFYGTSRKLIKQQLNMKEQTFAMNKANIEEKGWIEQGQLNSFLKSLQESINDNVTLEINIHVV
jgi:DNA-binding MarR family transcriptional regulator